MERALTVWLPATCLALLAATACSGASATEASHLDASSVGDARTDASPGHDATRRPDSSRPDASLPPDAPQNPDAPSRPDAAGDAPRDDGPAHADAHADAHHHHPGDAARDVAADAPLDSGNPLGLACSGATPSFASDVTPILNTCGGAELCHGGGISPFDSGPRVPWPYSALVNVMASRDTCHIAGLLVEPSSLEGSYLAHKVTGVDICPGTGRMPLHGAKLPDAEIQTIADWICQGALDN